LKETAQLEFSTEANNNDPRKQQVVEVRRSFCPIIVTCEEEQVVEVRRSKLYNWHQHEFNNIIRPQSGVTSIIMRSLNFCIRNALNFCVQIALNLFMKMPSQEVYKLKTPLAQNSDILISILEEMGTYNPPPEGGVEVPPETEDEKVEEAAPPPV
jgi:hypothetical protein